MNQSVRTSAQMAVHALSRRYRNGAYRIIKDPEGTITLWAIESNPNDPFSISFVDKGRVYNRLDDVPELFLKAFVEYVQKIPG